MLSRTNYRRGEISARQQGSAPGARCLPTWLAEPLERRLLLTSSGFIFVANGDGVGEYTTSGATVNAKLITGLQNVPESIAVSGSDLFVLTLGNREKTSGIGTVGEYTTSGATVNANLLTRLDVPDCITASASDLFIGLFDGGLAEYTTSGALVNGQIISGATGYPTAMTVVGSDVFIVMDMGEIWEYSTSDMLITQGLYQNTSPLFVNNTEGIVVSGSDMFFTNLGAIGDGQGDYQAGYGQISEYTTAGKKITDSLGGEQDPDGIAILGSDLFITYGNGKISEYTTSGKTVNANLVKGLSNSDPYFYGYPLAVTPAASISGTVFDDRNGDGIQESREGGMAGITLTLQPLKHGRARGRASTTTTNANGNYSFDSLMAGNYEVTESLPRGYHLTTPAARSYTIGLADAQDSTGNNFGDHKGKSSVVHSTTPFAVVARPAAFMASQSDVPMLLFASQDQQGLFSQ